MHRIFLVLTFLLLSFTYAQEPIKLIAKYNETTAREEVFSNAKRKIEKEFYKKYLKDPNRKENLAFIELGIFNTGKDRHLCPFYLKNTLASYAITYDETPQYTFYYNILGNLIKFDIIDKKDYPKKTLGYSRYGNLISAAFEVNPKEQYVYDDNGKLIAHWIEDTALDSDDSLPRFLKLKRGSK